MEFNGAGLAGGLWGYLGAVTGTVSLVWNIYSEVTRRRPKITVIAHRSTWEKHPPDPGDHTNKFVAIEVRNRGVVPVHLKSVGFRHIESPDSFLVNDSGLPKKLEPGENHMCLALYSELKKNGWLPRELVGYAYDGVGRTWSSGPLWKEIAWNLRWFVSNWRSARERRAREDQRD